MNHRLQALFAVLKIKIEHDILTTTRLGLWAGLYIALGGVLYSVIVSFDHQSHWLRLLGAMSFSVGLNLVVFRKAQLFTGNVLMLGGTWKGEFRLRQVLRNWVLVYVANLLGSLLAVSLLILLVRSFGAWSEVLGLIAYKKTGYGFGEAFVKAIYCNTLVCIAIWLAVTCTQLWAKLVGIFIPITLFVFLGFEHSVANMFFIPLGLFSADIPAGVGVNLFLGNLLPVSLGNVVGGGLVAAGVNFLAHFSKDG